MTNRKPNILWLMTDEQRTDSMGCYGSSWAKTPNLDRFAEQGVLFRNAITPAPVCLPARTSLLSGQYPCTTGIWSNDYTPQSWKPDSLVPLFANDGYRTASFGKQHHIISEKPFQDVFFKELSEEVGYFSYAEKYDPEDYGVVQYPPEPYSWIFGGSFPQGMDQTAEAQLVHKAKDWLEEQPSNQPFFLQISFNAPHTPVVPPYPFDSLIRSEDIHYPPETEKVSNDRPDWIAKGVNSFADASKLSAQQITEARRYYYGWASFADYHLGELLRWMDEHLYLENTIVVFVSDHGTHIGDYGLVQKLTFYEPVQNVPFFFWYPEKFKQGVEIRTPVEIQSLLPTLLDCAGIPIPEKCAAVSLADSLKDGVEPPSRPVFSHLSLGTHKTMKDIKPDDRLIMVRDGDWKLSVRLQPEPGDGALYHLAEDPYETHNLYFSDTHQDKVEHLTQLILQHVQTYTNK